MRPSVVADCAAEFPVVPGLSLDIVGEPLLEAAIDCGASGEKGSMAGNQSCKIRGQLVSARTGLGAGEWWPGQGDSLTGGRRTEAWSGWADGSTTRSS